MPGELGNGAGLVAAEPGSATGARVSTAVMASNQRHRPQIAR
jgi:hypothetical protein